MIITDDGSQLFVGEIVEVLDNEIIKVCSYGKVIKLMSKVKKWQFYQMMGITNNMYITCDPRE